MDISETPLAQEIDKHDDVLSFMASVTQQRKKGKIKIKPDKEGVGRYRELVNAYNKRKKRDKPMKQKDVIEYFDTYFSNFDIELNESTSNEQLEEAALDLVNLTESVIEFLEKKMGSVYVKSANLAQAKVLRKNLKRSILNPLTRRGRERNINRHIAMQTPAGREAVKQADTPGTVKKAKTELKTALERDPEAGISKHKTIDVPGLIGQTKSGRKAGSGPMSSMHPPGKVGEVSYRSKPSEAIKGEKYGKNVTTADLKKVGREGQDVHTYKRQIDAKKDKDVVKSGLFGVKSQAPKEPKALKEPKKKIGSKVGRGVDSAIDTIGKAAKVAGLIGAGGALGTGLAVAGAGMARDESVNMFNENEEERENIPYQDSEKMRISQKLLNVKLGRDWASREKSSSEQRRGKRSGNKKYIDDLVTRVEVENQPHLQKSLVAVRDGMAKSFTDKGRKGVEAETKRAATSAGSLLDIINKNPALKNRFEKGGTRKEREERGQGRFDFENPPKETTTPKTVPSHQVHGGGKGKGSMLDRFRTSTSHDPHSAGRRTKTKKGSEATK